MENTGKQKIESECQNSDKSNSDIKSIVFIKSRC